MTVGLGAKRDVVEIVFPAATYGASVTPGNSWANSAYVQVVSAAAMTTNMLLTGLVVYELINTTATAVTEAFEVDVAVGAAGAEVVVATVGAAIGYLASGTTDTKTILKSETLPIMPTRLDTGVRVAVRARKSGTNTLALSCSIIGYPAASYPPITSRPDPAQYLQAMEKRGGAVTYPGAGLTTLTLAGSVWTFGAWAEVVASAAAEMLITGYAGGDLTTGLIVHMEIGTGAAGSEVSRGLGVLPGRGALPGPGFGYHSLQRPIYVKPGERIAIRGKGQPANSTTDIMLCAQLLNN